MFRQTTKAVLKKNGFHAGEYREHWTEFVITVQGWTKADEVLFHIVTSWLPWIRYFEETADIEYNWEGGVKREILTPDGVEDHWSKKAPLLRTKNKGKITVVGPYIRGEGATFVKIYVR